MKDLIFDPAVWIVIGALISAFASWKATKKQELESNIQAVNNSKQQKDISDKALVILNKQFELDKKQDSLDKKSEDIISQQKNIIVQQNSTLNTQQEIINLNKALLEKAQKNESLALELHEAQKKISELGTETHNYITSKDSYCYVTLSIYPSDKVNVYLHHVGKYGLKNIEIKIINTDIEYLQGANRSLYTRDLPEDTHYFDNPYTIKVNSLTPNDVRDEVESFKTTIRDQKSFNVRFKTDNRTWYQRIILRRGEAYRDVLVRNNLSTSSEVDNRYYEQFQIYEIDNSHLKSVYRYERILMQTIPEKNYDYIYSADENELRRYFPQREGEVSPQSIWVSLHWTGTSFDRNPAIPIK